MFVGESIKMVIWWGNHSRGFPWGAASARLKKADGDLHPHPFQQRAAPKSLA
jgi:hypothetical protein